MQPSYSLKISPTAEPKIKKFLVKTRRELNTIYDVNFSMLPRVFLISSRKDFDGIKGKKTPDWMVAWAESGNIFILNPKVYDKESSHKSDFWKVLKHEYCHIFQNRITGGLRPAWLSEGAACFFANQKKSIPTRKDALLIFSGLKGQGKFNVYVVGYFWVGVLVKEFGMKKFILFLKKLSWQTSEKDFARIFKQTFGVRFSKKWGEKMYQG